jgi:transcriptional regulator with XRE-family HTH domain
MPRKPTTPGTVTPFGVWLRAARSAKGWTMEELAAEAGTAQAVVSNLERGARNPSRAMVERLSRALYMGSVNDSAQLARFQAEAYRAAGFVADAGIAPTDAMDALLSDESLIEFVGYEAGFDDLKTPFTDEEKQQLRVGINAFIRAWAEQKRKPKG